MSEVIVRRIGENRAEADREREEALGNGSVPNCWVPKSVPIRSNEEEDSIASSLESHRSDQQTYHNDVGEYGKEVRCFPCALHTAAQHAEDRCPTDEETESKLPGGCSNPIFNRIVLVQNDLPER